MTHLPKPLSFEGWACISLINWTSFIHPDGRADSVRTLVGYVRPVGQDDVPINLARDSRWALAVYDSETAEQPFHLVPGCKVDGVQFLPAKPEQIGYREYHYTPLDLAKAKLEKAGYKLIPPESA